MRSRQLPYTRGFRVKHQDHVITSDAIILDNCISWFNLASEAIEQEFGGYPYIDMGISRITE